MSMAIAKQTAAADSDVIHVSASFFKPATFVVVGTLGAAEEIEVLSVDEDGSELALYDADGIATVLTQTSAPLSFFAPIWVKFSKGVTAAAAGVMQVD